MKVFIKLCILVLLIASGNCARTRQTERQKGRTRLCSPPKLINGFVTPIFKGKMMRFDCNKGYYRLGERYSECANGRWSLYSFPICIKNGCSAVSTVDNGKITYLNRKATAMLFCEPNYEIVGSSFAHCNGTNWDRVIGTCRETDNLPALSCDFESESICGWTHDNDNDLDFERRNGYNNKTVSILTGPSVDHTIKVPFQGHYMVINTNTEVFTKTARLISPLYRLNATKICFELYYHMYGISVGTLRVYAKPESMEIQDVLIEDMEAVAKNDYVIFEMKGTQGNSWHKASGSIKRFNESFQIIVEATSGQTRLSDIAIDDVSIQTDEDCDDDTGESADNDTKETDLKEENDDNSDGIFSIDSCVNRCFEESNSTVKLNANKTLSCSCSRECDPKATCCPDFLDVCMKDDSSLVELSTPEATTTTTTTTTTLSSTKSTKIISILNTTIPTTSISLPSTTTTTISTTTSSSSSKKPTTSTSASTTSLSSSSSSSSSTSKEPKTTTQRSEKSSTKQPSDFVEISKNDSAEIEDEHEMYDDDDELKSLSGGKITNEKFMMHTATESNNNNEKFSFVVSTIVITASIGFLAFIAITIVYKQYKKSTNPLNYKDKMGENGSTRADEEFSEIRYLTSDEALDFSLATPDNMTDL